MEQKFKINGMSCGHCRGHVIQALDSLPGVTNVEVDLSTSIAVVTGDVPADAIIGAVEAAGYKATPA